MFTLGFLPWNVFQSDFSTWFCLFQSSSMFPPRLRVITQSVQCVSLSISWRERCDYMCVQPRTPTYLDFITNPTSLERYECVLCLQAPAKRRHSHPFACYMPDKVSMLKELTPWLRTDIQVSALIKGGLRSGNCEGINNMFIGIISSECNGE